MGQSLKAILQLLLIILGFATICVWGIPKYPDTIMWALRFGLPAIFGAIIWLLVRNMRRKENLPDLLGKITPRYFERDGFCFAIVPGVGEGVCWMQVFFQSRYERPCAARIVMKPARTFLGKLLSNGINVEINCEGAAFGVYREPWPVNSKVQGKKIRCEIGCSTKYPKGRGKQMRFREGMRCGNPGSAAGRAAATAGFLLIGAVYISRPARATLEMPTGVAETVPPDFEPFFEILWQADVPTGGFPVVPIKEIASDQSDA